MRPPAQGLPRSGPPCVTGQELAALANCLTGPAEPTGPQCAPADPDHDGDTDLATLQTTIPVEP
ncbi:MAG: hypothetical protein IT580_22245 [Verrucomicrobiales bacterium]|nr:hypothetical protein [Verrucomicrobiales bacterium]